MRRKALLSGLVSAPYTPFHKGGELNLSLIAQQAEAAKECLVGVFVCGTTGEGISMSIDERKAVAERWIEVRPAGLKIVVHVGGMSVLESRQLADHAQRIGADAISTMGPLGFRPNSIEALVQYSAEIASAASETPFFYYHMPSLNGVTASMLEYVEASSSAIPTFQGIKYTHEDLLEYALLIDRFGEDFEIVFGRDEYLLHALNLGARGAVGSTYNYMAPAYKGMMEKFSAGDMKGALADHMKITRIIEILIRFGGGVVAGKTIMGLCGLDLGPCRTPLGKIDEGTVQELRSGLEQAGFFNPLISQNHSLLQGTKTS